MKFDLAKINWWMSSGVSYDSDYQSLLDRATALGYTKPSGAQQVKQNAFVLELKSSGIWTLLDVLYVFANDGSENFAKINWKSPTTFELTKSGTITWTSNLGSAGNGTTGYYNTGWNASANGVNYALDNASAFHYNNTEGGSSGLDYGFRGNTDNGRLYFNPRTASDNLQGRINQNTAAAINIVANLTAVGFYQIQRTSAANYRVFKNGVQTGADQAQASGTLSVQNCLICAENINGTPSSFSTRQIGIFGLGAGLATKEAALRTAWNNYFTSL